MATAVSDSAPRAVVLISANAEWEIVCDLVAPAERSTSPFGAWFSLAVAGRAEPVIFLHGGWGKVAAAASTQYAIDRWQPELLVNLGTCGGFEGAIDQGAIVLAERTLIYDIVELMGDPEAELLHYATELDLSWLETPPIPVRRDLLISADRDLDAEALPDLRSRYGAAAGDWESGAIAYVARRNGVRCLILRGVSDLVWAGGGEAYGVPELFRERSKGIMKRLLQSLPQWLEQALPASEG